MWVNTFSFSKVKHFKKQATYARFYQSGSIHRDYVYLQQFCTSYIESDQDPKDISDGDYVNLASVFEFILKDVTGLLIKSTKQSHQSRLKIWRQPPTATARDQESEEQNS